MSYAKRNLFTSPVRLQDPKFIRNLNLNLLLFPCLGSFPLPIPAYILSTNLAPLPMSYTEPKSLPSPTRPDLP
jgi:hypothetical protein